MDWPRRHEAAGRAAARSQRRDVRLARDDCSLVLRAAQIELLKWERVELTGSSMGLPSQIWEWQVMQVCVGGSPAKAEVSTELWQYRQSIPRPPT